MPVQRQFGVLVMKNLEKGAVAISRSPTKVLACFRKVFAAQVPELPPANPLRAASSGYLRLLLHKILREQL